MMVSSRHRLALAAYAGWLAYTWNHKSRPDDWGPWHLARAVSALLRVIFRILGVRSLYHHPPSLGQGIAPCVVTVCPHGAFAIGHMFFSLGRLRCEPLLANFKGRTGAASVLFKVPVLREFLLLFNVREAVRPTLDAILRAGCSVAINPGGIWEQVHTSDEREQLYLQGNLGFIRMALRHGVPIVPSYAFGESQLLPTIKGGSLLRLREWVATKFRIGLPAIWPWLRRGLTHTFVLGNSVATCEVPIPHPTDEQVAECLERWVAEMQRLFKAHAHEFLPADVAAKGLTIVTREPVADVRRRDVGRSAAPSSASNKAAASKASSSREPSPCTVRSRL